MNDLEYLYSSAKNMAKFHAFAYHKHALHFIFQKQKLTPYSTLCPVNADYSTPVRDAPQLQDDT